jgi:hypothetical protein
MTIQRFQGCVALQHGIKPEYGYKPELAAGIAFCLCFGLSMFAHIYQAYHKRIWWTLVFAVGALSMNPASHLASLRLT